MKNIKLRVLEGIYITVIIALLVMIGICVWDNKKMQTKKEKLWKEDFEVCTKARDWGNGKWSTFEVME